MKLKNLYASLYLSVLTHAHQSQSILLKITLNFCLQIVSLFLSDLALLKADWEKGNHFRILRKEKATTIWRRHFSAELIFAGLRQITFNVLASKNLRLTFIPAETLWKSYFKLYQQKYLIPFWKYKIDWFYPREFFCPLPYQI